MTDDKPLHVRVAEALGWTRIHYRDAPPLGHGCGDILIADQERMRWKGRAPKQMLVGAAGCDIIPRYDTDWSATGPLIEKYGIGLASSAGSWDKTSVNGTSGPHVAYVLSDGWDYISEMWNTECRGATPLIAVCELLLHMAAEKALTALKP